MAFKLKPWHIFLLGFGFVYLITDMFMTPYDSGGILFYYLLIAGCVWGAYRLYIRKPKEQKYPKF